MEKKEKTVSLIKHIIESFVVFFLIFGLTILNLLSPIDYILRDKLYQIPRGINNDIKIIAIDDRTLEELGPINTWSRERYADLINILNTYDEAKPSVIAFDITFSGNVDEGDIAFADAAKESGNVVVVSQLVYSEKPEYDEDGNKVYPVETVVNPYSELMDVTVQGYSNVSQDSDSKVRRISISEEYGGELWEPFAKVIYDKYCDIMNLEKNYKIKHDKYNRSLINYSGKPGDYEAISMVDVLNGEIDPRAFENSIVLVGAYATGMQDNFNVPNGYSRQMFGVEIHANLLQAFMQNRFSIVANPYIVGLITGLCAALVHFIFRRKKVIVSTIVMFLAIALELLLGVVINNKGYCISLIFIVYILCCNRLYPRENET